VRIRTGAALLVALLLLAGCGAPGTGDDLDDTAAGGAPDELPTCPSWDEGPTYDPPPSEQPTPDPDLTTADAGAGPETIAAARAWAEREFPDRFAGTWIDQDEGAAVIAFTGDLGRLATEVRERFGDGWWVVRGDHSYVELQEVQQRVTARMGAGGREGTPPGTIVSSGLREDHQLVTVEVVGGDDDALLALAGELSHPAVCFAVLDPPPTYDEDGPVRTLATVSGWREDIEHAGAGVLEITEDREQGERAHADNVPDGLEPGDGEDPSRDGRHADLDTVDWDTEVIVVWSAGRSGSCPEWVEHVEVVDGAVEVRTATAAQGACTDDYNPYRAVLAVDAGLLPDTTDLPMPVEVAGTEGQAVPYPR
jgi:hypothetical protein